MCKGLKDFSLDYFTLTDDSKFDVMLDSNLHNLPVCGLLGLVSDPRSPQGVPACRSPEPPEPAGRPGRWSPRSPQGAPAAGAPGECRVRRISRRAGSAGSAGSPGVQESAEPPEPAGRPGAQEPPESAGRPACRVRRAPRMSHLETHLVFFFNPGRTFSGHSTMRKHCHICGLWARPLTEAAAGRAAPGPS